MRFFAYEVGLWREARREESCECGRFRLVISGAGAELPSCEGGAVDEVIVAAILEATEEEPASPALPMAVPKLAVRAS